MSRRIKVVGIPTKRRRDGGEHPDDCECESCGLGALVFLSDYEMTGLHFALRRTKGDGNIDNGDWHAQVEQKLYEART